ncbi:MAG: LysM peptidoglycan-binding domain-containing protein [Armatimonadetes bacterium]|nr:LysM peptidoglycan-binding domain-containing protein [Armatimonadota bacterium]
MGLPGARALPAVRPGPPAPRGAVPLAQSRLPRPMVSTLPRGERQSIGRVHVVSHTDTLAGIARRYHVELAALARINRLANPNVIRDGQRLVIPGRGLVVNGRSVSTDVRPLSAKQGHATAPLRPVLEALGGSVTWIAPTRTVHASTPQRGEVVITIGSSTAQVGDEKVLMDLAAYLDHNRTYLPVDFVSSALAVTIEIDPNSGDILVRSK